MREFRVVLPHRPGELAQIMEILGNNGVNVQAVATIASAETTVVAIVPYDEDQAREALQSAGINFEEVEILFVDVVDRPGELARVTRRFADRGINIESIYLVGKVGRGEGARVQVGFRLDNLKAAREVLEPEEEWQPQVGGEG